MMKLLVAAAPINEENNREERSYVGGKQQLKEKRTPRKARQNQPHTET